MNCNIVYINFKLISEDAVNNTLRIINDVINDYQITSFNTSYFS